MTESPDLLLAAAADRLLELCDEHTSGTQQLAHDVRALAGELMTSLVVHADTVGAALGALRSDAKTCGRYARDDPGRAEFWSSLAAQSERAADELEALLAPAACDRSTPGAAAGAGTAPDLGLDPRVRGNLDGGES